MAAKKNPPVKSPAPAKPAAVSKAPAPKAASPKPSAAPAKTAAKPAVSAKAAPAKPSPAKTPAGPASDAMVKAVGAPGAKKPAAEKPAPARPAPQPAKTSLHEAAFSTSGFFSAPQASESFVGIETLISLNSKLIAAFRANAEATLDHFQALANARSLSEMLELNGSYARAQIMALNAQAKEIASASLELAKETGKQVRGSIEDASKRR